MIFYPLPFGAAFDPDFEVVNPALGAAFEALFFAGVCPSSCSSPPFAGFLAAGLALLWISVDLSRREYCVPGG
jgi:hypothetical protein